MNDDAGTAAQPEGLRERKRKQTQQAITHAAFKLFSAQGYEATTLDAIAAQAGISRRTFFHYFKSKDEILLSLQGSVGESLIAELHRSGAEQTPWAATADAMRRAVARYDSDELIVLDRLLRSIEAVQARKLAGYAHDEKLVQAELKRLWPEYDETTLGLVAMFAIGVSRRSLDTWSGDGGIRPLSSYLEDALAASARLFR